MTAPAVVAVRCKILTAPLERPFAAASVVLDSVHDVIAVIVCDVGPVGLGYSTAFSRRAAESLAHLVELLGRELVGRTVHEWELPVHPRVRGDDVGTGGLVTHATGILATALLDAYATSLGGTVSEVLGSGATETAYYLSGGSLDATHAELTALATRTTSSGAEVLKVKIDGRDPRAASRRVEHLLDSLPERIGLAVDANQTFDDERALTWLEQVPADRIAWLEEPVPAEDVTALRAVTAASAVPIAAGETTFGTAVVDWVIDTRAADVLILNPTRMGGPHVFLDRVARAVDTGLVVHGHVYPHISTQLLGDRWPGSRVEYLPWWDRLFEPGAYEREDGRLRATGAVPGFGFSSDLRSHLTRV